MTNRKWMMDKKQLDSQYANPGSAGSAGSDQFTYRMTVLSEVDEEGVTQGADAETLLTLPFEADEDTLKEQALEQLGIFNHGDFSVESAEGGGFIIRDSEDEPFISLFLEEDSFCDEGDDLYSPFTTLDEMRDLDEDGR